MSVCPVGKAGRQPCSKRACQVLGSTPGALSSQSLLLDPRWAVSTWYSIASALHHWLLNMSGGELAPSAGEREEGLQDASESPGQTPAHLARTSRLPEMSLSETTRACLKLLAELQDLPKAVREHQTLLGMLSAWR